MIHSAGVAIDLEVRTGHQSGIAVAPAGSNRLDPVPMPVGP